MTSNPGISIIMPVYNGARYLASALATVQEQTLPNWELIVVDDGSTDDTPALLAQRPSDNRCYVIRQSNLGLAAARNRGLAAAQCEYIAFLDVDDAWHPSYLGQMCAALDRAPNAVAAFCGWQYSNEAGTLLPQAVVLSKQDLSRLDQDLLWRNSILPSGLVARRQAVLQAGGFDETLRACEDWDLWLRLKALGPFVAVPEVLMWYRTHSESMTDNIANIERERLKVNAKHLGRLDEPLADWPAARRQAVGFTYFMTALGYLRQQDVARGKDKARQALQCWPDLLEQDEFYHELGCAYQARGLRGTAHGLDLEAGAALIRDILADSPAAVRPRSMPVYWGRACLVLARLANNTCNRRGCRAYAFRALRLASGRDRLQALRLLAGSAVPDAWLRAAGRARASS